VNNPLLFVYHSAFCYPQSRVMHCDCSSRLNNALVLDLPHEPVLCCCCHLVKFLSLSFTSSSYCNSTFCKLCNLVFKEPFQTSKWISALEEVPSEFNELVCCDKGLWGLWG
jgi:hypothetical protein